MAGGASGSNANLVAAGPLLFHVLRAQCGESAHGRPRFYLPCSQPPLELCARLLATPLRKVPKYRYPRRKKQSQPALSHSGPLGSPTTPPNADQPIVHSPSQPETLTHQHCDPLKRFAPLSSPHLPFYDFGMHCTFFVASLHKTQNHSDLLLSCISTPAASAQRWGRRSCCTASECYAPGRGLRDSFVLVQRRRSLSVGFRSPLPVER